MLRTIRVLAFIAIVPVLEATGAASGVTTLSRPEIALREAQDGLTIFVADPERGLLAGAVQPGAVLPATEFARFPAPDALKRPVSVAVRSTRLIVVDGGVPAVFECDLTQQKWRELWRGEPLRAPSSVAIGADGTVVIGDLELRGLFMISPKGEPQVIRVGELPLRVRADERGVLYVLDSETGLVRLDEAAEPGRSVKQERSRSAALPVTTAALDFAIVRDVFYVADPGGLRVSVPGSRVSLPLPTFSSLRATDLAASDNFLAVLDQERMTIAVGDRPLPAESVLDHREGNPNAAWLDLLGYLVDRALVARRVVLLQSGETTYEEVLSRAGVLAPWKDAAKLTPPEEKVAALFCALNREACAGGVPEPPRPRRDLVVPQVTLRPTLDTESVVLNGRSVQQLVDERVLTREQRATVNDAYLARINPGFGNTLEAEMRRLGFLLATPMSPELGAGTLVQIEGGTERSIGRVSDLCDVATPARSRTSLAEHLDAPAAALPAALRPRGADRVQLTVTGWQREALPAYALARCRPKGGEGVYVIAEAISAMEVQVAAPPSGRKSAAQQTAGPAGRAMYIGYKPVPLSGLAVGVALPVSDLQALKPLPQTGALSKRTDGSMTLPVTRWRADLLLPVRDYYADSGPLSELRRRYAGLQLSGRERLQAKAMSDGTHAPAAAPWPSDVKKFLQEARERLRKAISYEPDLAQTTGTEGVYIGVVEDPQSVNRDHPNFAETDQSAWYDYSPNVGLHQHKPEGQRAEANASAAAPAAPSAPPAAPAADSAVPPFKKLPQSEHGTHVAGIIAARSAALTPGLLPSTNLVLIPSDKMASLLGAIEDARSEGVFIFNISQAFPPADATAIAEIRKRLVNSWQDSLFVVAAGNESDDLNASGGAAPASWAADLTNVIAVGATKSDGSDILGEHTDDDGVKSLKGSNFGSKVVDLLAPGQMICSLGYSGYAYGCGSSQAAPQVTAAAAMLWTLVRDPSRLRARLLYTADWNTLYAGKAWGGRLNVHRALLHPLKNIVMTMSEKEEHEVVLDGSARVSIDGVEYRRDGKQIPFRMQVPFSNILRLEERKGEGIYRVFLLKNGIDLAVVEGAVKGALRCKSMTHFDHNAQRFGARPHPRADCQRGIDVGQITDYVAGTPGAVRFF